MIFERGRHHLFVYIIPIQTQPVHPKGGQSCVFSGRTYVEAKTPIFGHLMQRVGSLEETLMLGGIGGRRRRG